MPLLSMYGNSQVSGVPRRQGYASIVAPVAIERRCVDVYLPDRCASCLPAATTMCTGAAAPPVRLRGRSDLAVHPGKHQQSILPLVQSVASSTIFSSALWLLSWFDFGVAL